MTRSEFDQQVRELRTKHGNAIREVAAMQAEIKEEIAAKYRAINDVQKEISKLQQSLQGCHKKRIEMETKFRNEQNDFIRKNEPFTTSNLSEATTLNIVYELRRRGFDGVISRDVDDEIESYDLQKQFEHPYEKTEEDEA